QFRQEELVAVAFGEALAFLIAGRFTGASAERVNAGKRDQRQHQHPVSDVPEQVAEPEADGEEGPESGFAPALRVGSVTDAGHGEAGEDEAGKGVNPVDVDHRARFFRWRSSRSRRVAWIRKAEMALGIAHTDSSKGVRSMP